MQMRGFFGSIGVSLDEFTKDVRSILDLMIKNLLSLKP